jgi:uncharacterized protein YdiU (UPF0061 family)
MVAPELAHHPAVIPRNHRVEAALTAAVEDDELRPLERLLDVLSTPYDQERAAAAPEYREPAPADAPPYRTFCGT